MCLALPARIVTRLPEERALVEIGGVCKEISLALLDSVSEGDYVIVHVGFALSRLDPEEAQKTLALLSGSLGIEEEGVSGGTIP